MHSIRFVDKLALAEAIHYLSESVITKAPE